MHYGPACGSVPSKLPTIYVFDDAPCAATACTDSITIKVSEKQRDAGGDLTGSVHVFGDPCANTLLLPCAAALTAVTSARVVVHPAVLPPFLYTPECDAASVGQVCVIEPVSSAPASLASDFAPAGGDTIVFIGSVVRHAFEIVAQPS